MRAARESRLFPAVLVAGLAAVLAILPGRYEVLPHGAGAGIGIALVVILVAAWFAPVRSIWPRLETWAILGFAGFATIVEIAVLTRLMIDMATKANGVAALTLLSTAVAIWLSNAVVFALAYWQIDRGGPVGRAESSPSADFEFPAENSNRVAPNWQPVFMDYLFLAYNTSTAFSPTDALPLTARAKALMIVQSLVSLVTIVAVAARAINILGS